MSQLALVNEGRFPTVETWKRIMDISGHLAESKALPSFIQNPAQLTMVLLAGKEAGMGPVEALNSYYIVNGKVVIYGQATLTQLKRAGFKVKWGDCDPRKATVTIISPDGCENTETYTMEEAVDTGQTGKAVWKQHPKSMLRWKALGANIRFFCPEVLNGHYVKEDIDSSGEVPEPTIDVEPITNPDSGDDNK